MKFRLPIGFAVLALCACAHSSSDTSADTTATSSSDQAMAEQAAAGLRDHHRHHHHGGVTQFIAMSLDTIGVDDAKRPQIDKIQNEFRTCLAPSQELEKTLLMTLADGAAAGSIDATKVDATIAKINDAAGAAKDCSAPVLSELHGVLSPAERVALVDKVSAHYDVWRQVNHEAQAGSTEKGGRLSDLQIELNLTPDQVTQLSTALHAKFADSKVKPFDPARGQAHVKAFETAFLSETFDPRSVTENANGHIASHGSHRMALFYETVVPLLTPEQRNMLADHLRQHASYTEPAVAEK